MTLADIGFRLLFVALLAWGLTAILECAAMAFCAVLRGQVEAPSTGALLLVWALFAIVLGTTRPGPLPSPQPAAARQGERRLR